MSLPYAITPTDTCGEQPRIATAPVRPNPDQDFDLLDGLEPQQRQHLLADTLRRMDTAAKESQP